MDAPSPYARKVSAYRHRLWPERRPVLGRLDLELTERCNNNCIHCCINLPVGDQEAKARELSTREVKDILAQAAALGALSVRFTGGEPLLREDFEELYVFARRQGLKVLLFTNARLVTPALARLFTEMPPLMEIEVSVYGLGLETYEAVSRTPGSFEEFWRGINLLLEHQVPFVVKSALLPQNVADLEAVEAWAATIPWMDAPPAFSLFFELRHRRDNPDKNRLIESLRMSPSQGAAFLRRNRERYLQDTREFCAKFMGPQGDRLFACGAGHGTCVDAYGLAQPCLPLRHPDTVYDLKNGSLKEALTEFFPALREMKATNPRYLKRCANCFLKGLCEQCPAKSWHEHGALDAPVMYLCRVAHAQALDLGLLMEGEQAWEVKNWKERIAWLKE